jgi:hypothetical protein
MARFGDLDTQYFDDAGNPLVNGKVYFYESGTTTLKNTFADVNLSIPNTNPVILTAAGRQPNIFFDGVAKAILTSNSDVQILVRDPVGETATDFGDEWVATKIYGANDVVLGSDGVYYRSLVSGNQNNNPVSTTNFWTLLYSVEWNAGITYQVGAVVTYDGEQYQSLQGSNLNQNPSTQTAYWVLLSFAWLATATYAEDQNAVGTDGILYTSLQNGNIGNDPATSPAYWVGTSAAAAASAVAAAASAAAALVSENAAAADAIATAADVVQTGLDAAATAADAIATAADRVQTGLDAAATAADVILTNADAVATAADRVQTGLDAAATSADAIATAADRVQTGLDVIATNADAIATAADAIATAADVVQTGLDVVATSADVVQTGLDVTAAAGSASAASGSASAAAGSAAAAAASYDAFDDRYLGDKASDPTLDNDGNALLTGALYFNTTSDVMKVYDGSAWNIAAISSASPTFTGTVTADGLNINGTATLDGLTVDGSASSTIATVTGAGGFFNFLVTSGDAGTINSPMYSLDMSRLGASNAKIDFNRGASGSDGFLTFATDATRRLNIASNGDISFYEDTGTTPKFFWDASAESLGIGTTSPASFTGLAANNLVVGSGSVNEGITIYSGNATNNYGAIAFADGVSGSEQYRGYILYQHDVDALRIATSGVERMRIDSSGRVGIGASPLADLHISSTSNTNLMISDSDAAADTKNWDINVDGSSLSFRLVNDANNAANSWLTAVRTGYATANVGIGTGGFNVLQKLHISTGTDSDAGTIAIGLGQISDGSRKATFTKNTTSPFELTIKSSLGGTPTPIIFEQSATQEAMRIDASGNVGIGTSSPAFSEGSGLEIERNSASATLRLQRLNTNASGLEIQARSSEVRFQEIVGSAPMTFYTGGSEKMRIDASGNVGIGTTSSPANTLEVRGEGIVRIRPSADSTQGALYLNDNVNSGSSYRADIAAIANGGLSFKTIGSINTVPTERMRIDSSGKVRINTTNTTSAGLFQVKHSTDKNLAITSVGSGVGLAAINDLASSNAVMGFNASLYEFQIGGTERLRIDSSGNLLLNTTANSGGYKFRFNAFGAIGDTDSALKLGRLDANTVFLQGTSDAGVAKAIAFMGSSEYGRFDSSGNLLVGKTVADAFTVVGTQIDADGFIAVTRDGSNTAVFNRQTNDGDIAQFRKNNTTVGSIGVEGGDSLYIVSGDTGLRFASGVDSIIPSNANGGVRDAAIDLGFSSQRFKDLYLSGGVYLGGTGAANKLDDYEEGTFTPYFYSDTGGEWAGKTTGSGFYTKIGRVVHIYGKVTYSSKAAGASNTLRMRVLPFTTNPDNIAAPELGWGDVIPDSGNYKIRISATDFLFYAGGSLQGTSLIALMPASGTYQFNFCITV